MERISAAKEGGDLTLIGYGILINELLEAAARLEKCGISAKVLKLSRIDSIDTALLESMLPPAGKVIVAEDCVETGSVGEFIAANLQGHTVQLVNLGRQGFVRQGSVRQQWRACGIDAESIAKKAAER